MVLMTANSCTLETNELKRKISIFLFNSHTEKGADATRVPSNVILCSCSSFSKKAFFCTKKILSVSLELLIANFISLLPHFFHGPSAETLLVAYYQTTEIFLLRLLAFPTLKGVMACSNIVGGVAETVEDIYGVYGMAFGSSITD